MRRRNRMARRCAVGTAAISGAYYLLAALLLAPAGGQQNFPAQCTNQAWTDALPYGAALGGQNLLRLRLQSEGGKYTPQLCQQECMNLTRFTCVAYAILNGTYSTENYCLMFAEPSNVSNVVVFTSYNMRTYIRPNVCLINGGCRSNGEYIAHYSNRCKFYRCVRIGNAPLGSNYLQAKPQDCSTGTQTSLNFTRSADGWVVTPCSVTKQQDCLKWDKYS